MDLTSTVGLVSMNNIGLAEGDSRKTNRERVKVYCSHCETCISKSAWYINTTVNSTVIPQRIGRRKRDLNHSLSILMIVPMNTLKWKNLVVKLVMNYNILMNLTNVYLKICCLLTVK